ncbi:hypothetical protein [Haladaptatus salinisoli]|uniref:hypothetical protein n=1 Tax=Haladaptatus salinisoli TaxID=2884876 RepID=UPI001D0A0B70|nr:hypothetical protein [Haladaptatus salinisoli]
MVPKISERRIQLLFVVSLLLVSPVIGYILIAGALTANAGLMGWVAIVAFPLLLLGVGLYLIALGIEKSRRGDISTT